MFCLKRGRLIHSGLTCMTLRLAVGCKGAAHRCNSLERSPLRASLLLCRSRTKLKCIQPLLLLLVLAVLSSPVAAPQVPPDKHVLIIDEVGLSHALTDLITHNITEGAQPTPNLHVEFHSESLDVISSPDKPTRAEIKDWLVKKDGAYKLDVVVAVGPDAINFLSNYTQTMFLDVPIVICGSAAEFAGNPRLDSRFTGTWTQFEPKKTIEAALRLFPATRHVVIIGGTTAFDTTAVSITKTNIASLASKVDLAYMTDLEMNQLLERVRQLPEQTIVLYISYFRDAVGHKFINATRALPMIAGAANAPLFGMSDTYLGHGIVGGDLMRFQEQGKVTARIVSELLEGKKAQDIPIESLPSAYVFDWKALQRWHIPEKRLPRGSLVLFREASLWERTKWIWATCILVIAILFSIAGYLLYSRKQLRLARDRQTQLSGMLITAEENERSRLASELHDDFSQRLAVLALGLENVAEATPPLSIETDRQLRGLSDSAAELGADLHTLSHRLHSATLERLGLATGISALCREFAAQQNVQINFSCDNILGSVHPNVALCLFRIVQEGIRNSKKHSGTSKVQVALREQGDKLYVSVRDEGCGFDETKLDKERGLGVRSMEERVHFLRGKFAIHSEPGRGTVVEAWVPHQPKPGPGKR
jgi:signal transduction histidine kinase